MMTTEQQQLFQKIQDFRLDKEGVSFPFSKRLASENHWSHAFALRVIGEYKKFVFLMMVSPTPVTPSVAVDQAWHLHLTYTQSYWEDLCENTLQRKLHHHPTEGGAQEDAKFENWYARTQDLYVHYFGQVPPADVWASKEPQLEKENSANKSVGKDIKNNAKVKKTFSFDSLDLTSPQYAFFCIPFLVVFAFFNLFNFVFFGLTFIAIYFIFFHKKNKKKKKFRKANTNSTQTSSYDTTSTFMYASNSESFSDSINSDSNDSSSGHSGGGSDAGSSSGGGSDAGSSDGGGSGCGSSCGGGGCGGGD